jgi:hypothetical protein
MPSLMKENRGDVPIDFARISGHLGWCQARWRKIKKGDGRIARIPTIHLKRRNCKFHYDSSRWVRLDLLLCVREIHQHHVHDYLMNPSATSADWCTIQLEPVYEVKIHSCVNLDSYVWCACNLLFLFALADDFGAQLVLMWMCVPARLRPGLQFFSVSFNIGRVLWMELAWWSLQTLRYVCGRMFAVSRGSFCRWKKKPIGEGVTAARCHPGVRSHGSSQGAGTCKPRPLIREAPLQLLCCCTYIVI